MLDQYLDFCEGALMYYGGACSDWTWMTSLIGPQESTMCWTSTSRWIVAGAVTGSK